MAAPIICASVRVAGHRQRNGRQLYTPEWTNRLHQMMQRHIAGPVRHVCLTDAPSRQTDARIQEVDVGRWWRSLALPAGWWAKVALFDPGASWAQAGERIVFSDLDNLIVAPLDPLLATVADAPVAFAPDTAPNFKPPGVVKLYSSAFMVWTHGQGGALYSDFKRSAALRYRGDQDWFGARLPRERIIDGTWFQRLSESVVNGRVRDGAAVIFCVKQKNDIAAAEYPWVKEIWTAGWPERTE